MQWMKNSRKLGSCAGAGIRGIPVAGVDARPRVRPGRGPERFNVRQ
jgi:hypothetical protein